MLGSTSTPSDKASAWEKLLLIHQQPVLLEKRSDTYINDETYRTLLGAESVVFILKQYVEDWGNYLDFLVERFPEVQGHDNRLTISLSEGQTSTGDSSLAKFDEFRTSPTLHDSQKSAKEQRVCIQARHWNLMDVRKNRMQLGITSYCFLLVSSLYDELMINEAGGKPRAIRRHLFGELRSLITM